MLNIGSNNSLSTTGVPPKAGGPELRQSNLSNYFSYLYLFGGFISLVCNLSKADVNIALYAFLYLIMRHAPQLKAPFKLLLVFSIVIDILWVIFVHLTTYESAQFFKLVPWESGLRSWTFWMSVVNLGIKSFVAAVLFFCDTNKMRV